jgi:tetratricopeptide (TPR) repeat protein
MRNFIGSMFGKSKKDNPPEGRKKRATQAGRPAGAAGTPIQGTPYKKGDFIGKKYEVYDVLGKGGFGIVYLVYACAGGVYALKTFRDEYMEDEATRERFRKEAQVWVDLERHPYLVRAYFVDEINGRLYIAMEHIAPDEQGLNSLDGYLQRRPPDVAQTLRWAVQFCYGMEHAYSKGLRCHRDIKPSNIMLTQDGTIKVSDFGLAGVLDTERPATGALWSGTLADTKTMKGTSFGTPEYMPPEQFVNAAGCDERSDIYSFGVTLYQMTSRGRLPFTAPERTFNAWHKVHVESALPDSDSPLSRVIRRCLEKELGRRYASFSALRAELEPLLRFQTGEVVKPPESKALEEWEWCDKGASLNFLGKHEEAIRCLDRALEVDPRDTVAWLNKGAGLCGLGRHEEAIRCYDRALEIDPRFAPAWTNKGLSFGILCRYEEAIRCYDRALEIDPRDAGAWFNRGANLHGLGRNEEATRSYDRALEIDPNDARAWCGKGKSLGILGRNREAIGCCDRALEIEPRLAHAWNYKGVGLYMLGRNDEAVRCWDRALEVNPRLARAWFFKGLYLRGLDRSDEAVLCFDRALEIDRRDASAWSNKGVSLASLGRNEEAIPCYDRALEIDPRGAATWIGRGASLNELGRYDEAMRCYRSALEIDPRSALAWKYKGNSLDIQGRYEQAIRCYDRALEIDPRDAGAWHNKGDSLSRQGRNEEAIPCYDRALEIDPRHARAWCNKGISLHGLGRNEEAIRCFGPALEIDPRSALAWYNKALAEEGLGRKQDAVRSYRQFLILASAQHARQVEYARERLQDLEGK